MKYLLILLVINITIVSWFFTDSGSEYFWTKTKSFIVDHHVEQARMFTNKYGCPNQKDLLERIASYRSGQFDQAKKEFLSKWR